MHGDGKWKNPFFLGRIKISGKLLLEKEIV
jgi:hypothetical protein